MTEAATVNILLVGEQPTRLMSSMDGPGPVAGTLVLAATGAQALEHVATTEFAIIVLDASSADADGFATAALIRAQPDIHQPPIILLTGTHVTRGQRIRGHQLRNVYFVDIPAEHGMLRDRVARILEVARKRRDFERLNDGTGQSNAELALANRNLRAELARANRTREAEAAERERVEDALRQTEARLSVVLDSTSVAIGQIDLDNRFVYVNRGFAELLGLEGTDVRGRSLHELLRPEIADAFEANLRRVIADDRPLGFEEFSETTDQLHAYSAVNSPIRDADGNPSGVVCVFTDITERKRLETALLDADRRKDEFLAVLAHELRNPLSPILNAARVMSRRHLDDPELQWCSDVIRRQTEHMARLVDDLLDVARITQGKIALHCEGMGIDSAIARAVEANRPLLDSLGQELLLDIPDPSPRVYGDMTRLGQVIGNLLNNAVKYTPAGGTIRIGVEQVASERSSVGDVLLTISDSGMGIPIAMLPKVFDLFTQIDDRARAKGGLGIGLALVSRLVHMHGGTVIAESEGANKGSRFIVRLPALRDERGDGSDRALAVVPSSKDSGLSVLVVDDNKDAAMSLAILLRMAGHLVETAHDGLEAVDAAERFRPDVVLMDLGMPGLDGYGATRLIRAEEWGRKLLIVALTGWGQDDARALTKAAGFDAHLVKPVDFDKLSGLLLERAHRGGTALALPNPGAHHDPLVEPEP